MSNWNAIRGTPEPSRRRSQRVILSLPITVRGEGGPSGASFEENTQTLVVNAHGALITIAAKVEKGQTLRLSNGATQEEELCRVIYVGQMLGGKVQVGVEFHKPSPDFWRIAFPPEDWTAPEPEQTTHNFRR